MAQVRKAKNMLKTANSALVAKDEAVRYETLDVASKLAAKGGDIDLSFKAIDAIAKLYDIDPMAR